MAPAFYELLKHRALADLSGTDDDFGSAGRTRFAERSLEFARNIRPVEPCGHVIHLKTFLFWDCNPKMFNFFGIIIPNC